MEIHKFHYNWKLAEANFTKDKGKVFSCFACGGGSTMGYKLAGFDVIGCNEIDPKVNLVYVTNHAPRFNFLGDIRELRERERESYHPNFTTWIFWTAHPHVPLSPYPATVKRIGAKKRCSERGKRHKFLIHFSSTSLLWQKHFNQRL